jgi:hypothetical protein
MPGKRLASLVLSLPAWRCLAMLVLLLMPALAAAAQAQSDGATPHQQVERTTGDWQQFVADGNGAWRPLGVYRVEQTDGTYRMTPVDQSEAPDVVTSKGLSDVRFEGTGWQFKSDWGKGDVGEFRLQRVAPGMYAGWSYLRDEQRNYNLWLLIR